MDKSTKAEYQRMISTLQDNDRLTKWEEDFLESIRQRLDEGWNLTDNQADTLERIWDEKGPRTRRV